jgi:hypothetical protein
MDPKFVEYLNALNISEEQYNSLSVKDKTDAFNGFLVSQTIRQSQAGKY